MLKAVIFDLDGTLINTLEDLTDAVNFGLGCAGMPKRSVEEVREFVGNGIIKLLERSAYPITDSAVFEKVKKGFYEFYGAHGCDKTEPYEGINELLSALRSRGLLTAVVTNKDDAAAKQILHSLLGDRFTVIRGKTDEYPAKPAPDSTLSVMRELGVEPFECIFLGDSGVDIQTGVNSGAIAVGETWGFRNEAHLLENGAKYIIHEPLELMKLIDSLNN